MSDSDDPDAEERRARAFLRDAYALETEADTRDFYARWADEYDAQLERGLRYIAPQTLVEMLARHLAAGDAPILDVGCGTGLTPGCLRALGFSAVDRVDFSRAMLEKAAEKGVYRKLIEADLTRRCRSTIAATPPSYRRERSPSDTSARKPRTSPTRGPAWLPSCRLLGLLFDGTRTSMPSSRAGFFSLTLRGNRAPMSIPARPSSSSGTRFSDSSETTSLSPNSA